MPNYTLCFAFDAGTTARAAAHYVDQAGNVLGTVTILDQFLLHGSLGITLSISAGFQGFVEFTDADTADALVLFAVNPQEGENVDEKISILADAAIGAGGIQYTHQSVDISNKPIGNCAVWITSDVAGRNTIAGTGYTDSGGHVTFNLDAGTWYLWERCRGYTFNNPTQITVR